MVLIESVLYKVAVNLELQLSTEQYRRRDINVFSDTCGDKYVYENVNNFTGSNFIILVFAFHFQ